MTARLAASFPFVLAAVLPLVGVVYAAIRFAEKRHQEAGLLLASAALGATIYAIVLTG